MYYACNICKIQIVHVVVLLDLGEEAKLKKPSTHTLHIKVGFHETQCTGV